MNIINIENIHKDYLKNGNIKKDTLICVKVTTHWLFKTTYRIYSKLTKQLNRLCPGKFVNIKVIQKKRIWNPSLGYGYINERDGIDDTLHPDNYKYSVRFTSIKYKNGVSYNSYEFDFDESSMNEYQMTFTGSLLLDEPENIKENKDEDSYSYSYDDDIDIKDNTNKVTKSSAKLAQFKKKTNKAENTIISSPTEEPSKDDDKLKSAGKNECPVCFKNLNKQSLTTLPCKHVLCRTCLNKLQLNNDLKCPICRQEWEKR